VPLFCGGYRALFPLSMGCRVRRGKGLLLLVCAVGCGGGWLVVFLLLALCVWLGYGLPFVPLLFGFSRGYTKDLLLKKLVFARFLAMCKGLVNK